MINPHESLIVKDWLTRFNSVVKWEELYSLVESKKIGDVPVHEMLLFFVFDKEALQTPYSFCVWAPIRIVNIPNSAF